MDTSKVGQGEKVAAAAGVALFIILFLPWYGAEASFQGRSSSTSGSAWEVFSYIDIVLFLVALLAVGLAVARAAGAVPALPVPAGVIVHVAGALAVILIIYRLIDTPGDTGSFGGVDVDITRKIGIFLGLIAAAAISVGGRMAIDRAERPRGPGDLGG